MQVVATRSASTGQISLHKLSNHWALPGSARWSMNRTFSCPSMRFVLSIQRFQVALNTSQHCRRTSSHDQWSDLPSAHPFSQMTGAEHLLRSNRPYVGSLRRHAVDPHSNKSGPGLTAPSASELEWLVKQALLAEPPNKRSPPPKPMARSLRRRLSATVPLL